MCQQGYITHEDRLRVMHYWKLVAVHWRKFLHSYFCILEFRLDINLSHNRWRQHALKCSWSTKFTCGKFLFLNMSRLASNPNESFGDGAKSFEASIERRVWRFDAMLRQCIAHDTLHLLHTTSQPTQLQIQSIVCYFDMKYLYTN